MQALKELAQAILRALGLKRFVRPARTFGFGKGVPKPRTLNPKPSTLNPKPIGSEFRVLEGTDIMASNGGFRVQECGVYDKV